MLHFPPKTNMSVSVMVLLLVHIVGGSFPSSENTKKEFTWNNFTRIAKSGINSAVKMAMPFMFRAISTANVSNNCERGLMLYMTAIRKLDSWAVKMLDASSKIQSGLLEGTIMDFGSFDECLGIKVKENSRNSKKELFQGRYCTMSFRTPLLGSPLEKTSDGRNYTDVYGHPPDWANELLVKLGVYLAALNEVWMGLCVPSVCSENDIRSISTTITEPFDVKVSVVDCQIDEPYIWKRSTLAAVCALGCIAFLCGIGTLLDIKERYQNSSEKSPDTKKKDGTITRALKVFSLLTNTEKLFSSGGESGHLDCFNGIRFLSATWIIMGHSYFYSDFMKYFEYRSSANLADQLNKNLPFTVIENFTHGVSTFLFMSGFLLVYTTWKQLEKRDGRINLFMFFIHKYWRMAPGLLLILAMLFAMPLVDSGPMWNAVLEPHLENCQKNWWKNVLFIHNWWDKDEICLDYTWYLAGLLQMHIVGILLLILIYRWPVAGISVSLVTAAFCVTLVAWQVVLKNYPMSVFSHIDNFERFFDMGQKIYIKPFLHFPTYLVGMVGAYFVLKYRCRKIAIKYQTLGWIISIGLALLAIYGVHLNADHVAARAIYLGTSRIGWACSLAWMTYACASGFGGIVNRILSFPAMRPLGQISFLTYLIHYLVILYKIASARERIYNGHSVLVFSAFSTMVAGFGLAYIGYVAVEMPFAALEKIIFRSSTKKSDIEKSSNNGQTVVTPNGVVTSF